MTVEIAILNLEAVALAADSAVTVRRTDNGPSKIYAYANKLFALSEVAPVGILTYGNASFMAIPWETLIKQYRRTYRAVTFDTLAEYADSFCKFLENEASKYITTTQQNDYATLLIREIYREIDSTIDRELNGAFQQSIQTDSRKSINRKRLNSIYADLQRTISNQVIEQYYQNAKNAPLIEDAPSNFERDIRTNVMEHIKNLKDGIFGRTFSSSNSRKLNFIAIRSVCSFLIDISEEPDSGFISGIAIAGFGESQVFPAIVEIHTEGLVQGALKKRVYRNEALTYEHTALVVPFAQSDMIYQFMEGIAPEYQDYINQSLEETFGSHSSNLVDLLNNASPAVDFEPLRESLREANAKIANLFMEEFQVFRHVYSARQIMGAVETLPKEHLAEMAEALVNLTSLKRRVSLQEETVGGPTDVAVITKGDGMIWVKRKQYFPSELNNPQFP